MFSHESRTHALPFKPYDINLGLLERFSSHFLVCIAGGSLSWNSEGIDQPGPVTFGLPAGLRG